MKIVSNGIVITVIISLVISFIFGVVFSYFLLKRRFGGIKELKKAQKDWESRLKSTQNKLWELSKKIENSKQEAAVKISDFKKKKEQAISMIAKINDSIENKQNDFNQLDMETRELQKMQRESEAIKKEYDQLPQKKEELSTLKARHESLKSEISLYSDMDYFIEYGLYPLPKYGEASRGAYNEELKEIRSTQKDMVKLETAYDVPYNFELTGNNSYDKKVAKNQGRLLITAFNTECDYLISKVNSKNYEATLTRIEKLAEQLEKRLVSLEIGISLDYVELKMKECTVYYQYICQKAAEAEEQREIRAQIREEVAAQREIERALKEAEKEERLIQQAMEKARKELEMATAEQRQQFEEQLEDLETKLAEAEARGERALSMAQQTKRGHVYIISNIGSFGKDIVKIGMTRRLEPLDRVKELGDASVPFPFDVHAMILSENAPALEKEMHQHFEMTSVNKVNNRKEFFEVPIKDIRSYLEEKDVDVHWTMTAEATEYRQSLAIHEQQERAVA